MQTGMLRLVDPEAMLINFERADLRFERRSRDPEPRRRTRRTRYAAFARGERRLDSRPLVGCQFVIQRSFGIRLDDALPHEPTLIDAQGIGIGHNDRPLDDILQFSNVAWPRIIAEQIERLFADSVNLLPRSLGIPVNKVLHQ